MTTDKRIANAIKWIDALDPKEGYKKSTSQLGIVVSEFCKVNDPKKDMKYCCLGVACRVMGYEDVDYAEYFRDSLVDDMGLFGVAGKFKNDQRILDQLTLADLNDLTFNSKNDFKEIRDIILDNFDLIFIPEVAEGLKRHYNVPLECVSVGDI